MSQLLLNAPSFDRPSFTIPSSSNEFEFISPLSSTLSFLYLPIQRDCADPLRDILLRSADSVLTDEEVHEVGNYDDNDNGGGGGGGDCQ